MEQDSLKNIIAKNLKEKPSKGFTDSVMKSVSAQADEAFLKTTLKANLIYNTPNNFTAKALQNIIQKEQVTAYQPVIAKKVWYILGVIFVSILAIGINSSTKTVESKYISMSLEFFNSKLNLFLQFLVSNSFIMLLIISISGLIIIDFLLKSEKNILKKT